MNHSLLLVFIGGGLGSVLRYLTVRLLPTPFMGISFPMAILLVNVIASALLGWISGWLLSRWAGEEFRLLIGVGFCGGLSTFSSFSYDTLLLLQQGRWMTALLNILLNMILCTIVTAGGFWLGQS